MQVQGFRFPTGNVYRVEGKRRPVWYARYRLPDGREVRKKIGPAWTGRGRPAAGHFTKRTAEAWLSDVLDQARRGTLPGAVRTGATFADAAAEYLRYIEVDRGRKATTVQDYRSVIETHLLPAFADMRLEDITAPMIERWLSGLRHQRSNKVRLSNRSRNKILVVLHGVFQRACRVWGLPLNPAAQVERHPQPASGDIDVFTPEEVHALAREADNEQDAAIFAVAAFTGLRMGELRALRWRDIDFAAHVVRVRASYANGVTTTPKSGKVRSVPLVDAAAEWLARLDRARASHDDGALVFIGGSRRPPLRRPAALALRQGARARRPAAAAFPRPAPHVRIARDQSRRHRRGPGVDGPCRRQDHDALPALPRPGGCGCSAQCGLHGGPRAR